MSVCGVYEIFNSVTGMVYIGSSKDISYRFSRHRKDLLRGSHHNQYLQRSWDKHGESGFVFRVVEVCNPSDRWACEEKHFGFYQRDQIYNLVLVSKGGNRKGLINSPEHRARISSALRALRGRSLDHWSKGRPNTWAKKSAISMLSHYPFNIEATHPDGRVMTFFSITEAALKLGCSASGVSDCVNGKAKSVLSGWKFRRVSKLNLENTRWPKNVREVPLAHL